MPRSEVLCIADVSETEQQREVESRDTPPFEAFARAGKNALSSSQEWDVEVRAGPCNGQVAVRCSGARTLCLRVVHVQPDGGLLRFYSTESRMEAAHTSKNWVHTILRTKKRGEKKKMSVVALLCRVAHGTKETVPRRRQILGCRGWTPRTSWPRVLAHLRSQRMSSCFFLVSNSSQEGKF